MKPKEKAPWKRRLSFGYVIAFALSWFYQWIASPGVSKLPLQDELAIKARTEGGENNESLKIRYLDTRIGENDDRPVALLLQGSPMASASFEALNPYLTDYRLIIPDLPGFGHSQRNYSVKSHAAAMDVFLSDLGIEKAHVVGYRMGGRCRSRDGIIKSGTYPVTDASFCNRSAGVRASWGLCVESQSGPFLEASLLRC